jgi:hypothetical protein
VFEANEITGVARRERERLYTARHASPALIAAAPAERGTSVGAIVRHGTDLADIGLQRVGRSAS